jgi:peptidoglycan/xylan/chitin deacetylase (PgdA/CDA1 family)
MSAWVRVLVAGAALAVGSWLGLGRPTAQAAVDAGRRTVASVAGALGRESRADASGVPPPIEGNPPQVDASRIPDPPPPFPRLNPTASTERAWLLAEGPARGPADGLRLVTFTFDDGPFPETTPTLLRLLDDYRIRAAFFLLGRYLDADDARGAETRAVARKIAAAGHYVGNHTWGHVLLTAINHAHALSEIDNSAAAIERVIGKRPLFFRPPYGQLGPYLEGSVRERGLELVLWSVDVGDMKREDPDEIARHLEHQLEYKGGGIVLLHDVHWPSIKAFSKLVTWLRAHPYDPKYPSHAGYRIVDLVEYMRATQALPQPYATREQLEKAREKLQSSGHVL